MNEIALQSANYTNRNAVEREAMQEELNALVAEINDIAGRTEFNTQKLIDGDFKDKKFHIGANKDQNIVVNIDNMDASAIGVAEKVTLQAVSGLSGAVASGLGFVDGSGDGLTNVNALTNASGEVYAITIDDKQYAIADVEVNSSGTAVVAKEGASTLVNLAGDALASGDNTLGLSIANQEDA